MRTVCGTSPVAICVAALRLPVLTTVVGLVGVTTAAPPSGPRSIGGVGRPTRQNRSLIRASSLPRFTGSFAYRPLFRAFTSASTISNILARARSTRPPVRSRFSEASLQCHHRPKRPGKDGLDQRGDVGGAATLGNEEGVIGNVWRLLLLELAVRVPADQSEAGCCRCHMRRARRRASIRGKVEDGGALVRSLASGVVSLDRLRV